MGLLPTTQKWFYERNGIAAILGTDNAGANRFIAELANEE
jgi:hypothetical protein